MTRGRSHLAGLALLALIGAAHCGGTVLSSSSGTTSGTSSTGSSSSSTSSSGCLSGVPANHRVQEATCAPSMPGGACTTDADCIEGNGFGSLLHGTCTTTSAGQMCDYNTCTTDASCPAPTDVCSCQGQSGNITNTGSACVPADCHTDADCGPGGYCSQTPAFCGGALGWYCHTCADTCVEDTDCPADPNPGAGPFCAFDPTVGHWSCAYTQCAG
jgi:hypothetical protein